MNWGAPDVLMGLWVLPVLAVCIALALRSRSRALKTLGPLIGGRVGKNSRSRNKRRLVLLWLVVGLILSALALPRLGYRWQELHSDGLSVVVALDTSRSMDAEDVSPNRMERAKREVLDLTEMLQGDRVGLVIFSGGAYPRMPLTLDYAALQTLTRRTTTKTLGSQGSDIGAAIDASMSLLGPEGEADRAIIIISDGEDQGSRAIEAAQRAKKEGVRIFSVGVGTDEGAPIPLASGGFKKSKDGNLVLTRIQEETLREIASITEGAYVRSVAGSGDIRSIYQDEILGSLQRAEQMVRREKIWEERFQWPLGLAWVLAILAFVVRGRGAVAAVGLSVLLASPMAHAESTQLDTLMQDQIAHPNDLGVAEQLGTSLYKAKRYNEAAEVMTSVADRSTDPLVRSRARYNAGLSAYKGGRLTQALEAWQRVLQDQPDHAAAKQNVAAVQQEIQKRLGEEPPDQDSDDQKSDEQNDGDQSGEQDPESDDTGSPDESPPEEPKPPEEPEGGDTGSSSDQNQEPEPSESSGGDTGIPQEQPAQVGEISQQEAERMFEGVEEGEPRVVINPGSRGGNDW
jgi:Ca-activated chloride channel family protein